MSANIKFPDEHYIGMITNRISQGGKDDLPLAFMTPQGTDKAAEKRRCTVDGWVSSNARRGNKSLPSVTVKNEAIGGFRLLDDVKHSHGWGAGNVKWRIEDPRGFELEISSPNLMNILACSVIDCGEVLDQCIWARDGSENVLVPVSSNTYKQAVDNTERMNKTASLRDLKAGDNVILHNGVVGRYYGKFHTVDVKYGDRVLYISDKRKHIIVEDVDNSDDTLHLYALSSLKLSEIIPKKEILPEDGLRLLNEMKLGWFSLNKNVELKMTKTNGALPVSYGDVCIAEIDDEYWEVSYEHFKKEYKLTNIKSYAWLNDTQIEYDAIKRGAWVNTLRKYMTEADMANVRLHGRIRELILDNGTVLLFK